MSKNSSSVLEEELTLHRYRFTGSCRFEEGLYHRNISTAVCKADPCRSAKQDGIGDIFHLAYIRIGPLQRDRLSLIPFDQEKLLPGTGVERCGNDQCPLVTDDLHKDMVWDLEAAIEIGKDFIWKSQLGGKDFI